MEIQRWRERQEHHWLLAKPILTDHGIDPERLTEEQRLQVSQMMRTIIEEQQRTVVHFAGNLLEPTQEEEEEAAAEVESGNNRLTLYWDVPVGVRVNMETEQVEEVYLIPDGFPHWHGVPDDCSEGVPAASSLFKRARAIAETARIGHGEIGLDHSIYEGGE